MRVSLRIPIVLIAFFVFFIMAINPLAAEVLVQVMSVQDEAAAKKEADRLFDLGIPTFSRAEQVPDLGVWNRVYLGPFDTESDAAVAAETLKKQGTIKDFVVKSGSAPEVSAGLFNDEPAATPDGAAPVIGSMETGTAFVDEPPLPVAEIPTYGEPISPEQAREMGLATSSDPLSSYGQTGAESNSGPGGLTTYGQATESPLQPSGSLPAGLKKGDDMPGLAPQPYAGVGGGQPASILPEGLASGDDMPGQVGLPSQERGTGLNSFDDAAGLPDKGSSAPIVAPSAGEGDEPVQAVMVAQAGDLGSSSSPQSYGGMNLAGFTMLVDLSSSMRRMTNCQARIKEEAVSAVLRKMNRRIPNQPYNASMRVFGYKMALTRNDFTTLYYGPETYNREAFEGSIAKLIAADSVSPFATAINASDNELMAMGNPKAILMFADFEESIGSGAPVKSASDARRRYGNELSVYTFYITRQNSAVKLAKEIAKAGGGQAYDICRMLNDDVAFEQMMMDIFGPGDAVPCSDQDGDGVCDEFDLCPNTPAGAPVDERGCWIAAYAQFFDFDKAIIKSAFLPRIKHAAEIIINNPGLPKVVIAGHTDNFGTSEYNMQLGLNRAQSVFNQLVKDGVDPSRLAVESFGETKPVATNSTEEGRARNRRVEFHVGEVPERHGNAE